MVRYLWLPLTQFSLFYHPILCISSHALAAWYWKRIKAYFAHVHVHENMWFVYTGLTSKVITHGWHRPGNSLLSDKTDDLQMTVNSLYNVCVCVCVRERERERESERAIFLYEVHYTSCAQGICNSLFCDIHFGALIGNSTNVHCCNI